jgi:hypothetical protein
MQDIARYKWMIGEAEEDVQAAARHRKIAGSRVKKNKKRLKPGCAEKR